MSLSPHLKKKKFAEYTLFPSLKKKKNPNVSLLSKKKNLWELESYFVN